MAFIEDIIDKVTRKLGQAFLRNPSDTANMGDNTNPVRVDPTGTTIQPVSIAALPLPSGGATEAKQDIGNSSLSSIDGKLNSLGQKAKVSSIPMTLASDQATDASPLVVKNPRAAYGAFGRLLIASPTTLFDSKQTVNNQPLFWDDQLISGAGGASTYNANQSSTTLSTTAATAMVRARQTFQRFNYQPGKSQKWLMTGIIGTPAAGITRRIGQFDDNNGVFFESSTTMKVVVRTFTSGASVDTAVNQASWNIDKLDGTGSSGITADWSKVQIFGSFYEWLGVGSVWFFVVIGGEVILTHRVDDANSGTLVYMSTPNLPLRYEIRNSGAGGAASITHICAVIMSEGGQEDTGLALSINRGTTLLSTNNNSSVYPVMALRLGSTFLGTTIKILGSSIVCTTNAAFNWQLILNPTVVGTAFSFSAITNSSLEADVSTTNATTVTGGTILAGGTLEQTNEGGGIDFVHNDLRLGSTIAGVSDVIVVAVQRITGTSESFAASMNWREIT
jgi:hypothetical protein